MTEWPDDVKRVKDAMDMHALAGAAGQFAVFKLSDGTPVTNDTYPARGIARQYAEKHTMDALLILEVQPDGMPYNEAKACLDYERALWKGGFRTPDYDWESVNAGLLSMPRTKHDQKRMIKQLVSGKPITPDGYAYGNLPELRKGNRNG